MRACQRARMPQCCVLALLRLPLTLPLELPLPLLPLLPPNGWLAARLAAWLAARLPGWLAARLTQGDCGSMRPLGLP